MTYKKKASQQKNDLEKILRSKKTAAPVKKASKAKKAVAKATKKKTTAK